MVSDNTTQAFGFGLLQAFKYLATSIRVGFRNKSITSRDQYRGVMYFVNKHFRLTYVLAKAGGTQSRDAKVTIARLRQYLNVGGNAILHRNLSWAMMTKIKTDFLKLGWYQIIGGIIGILIILYSVISLTQFSGLIIFIYSFVLLFFTYSIYCGTLCVQNKNNALTHSLINQVLQILGFAIFGFAFTYVAGIYVSVGLDLSTSINMNFNFGISNFDFNINRERERTEINFNLVALGLIFWIHKLKNKVKEEETNIEIATIGQ